MAGTKYWVVKITSFVIFSLCLFGVIFKVTKCWEKYSDNPEGVEISTKPQNTFEFPALTFCPVSSTLENGEKQLQPAPYNWTWLNNCGISEDFREIGQFIGNSSEDCKDTSRLWDKATPKLEDFGIESVSVQVKTGKWIEISLKEDANHWRRIVTSHLGPCYSLEIPRNITDKMIQWVWIQTLPSHTLYILFHSKGFIHPMNPWFTVESAYNILTDSFEITYIGKQVLNFDGLPCNNSNSYDFTSCLQSTAYFVRFTFLFRVTLSIFIETQYLEVKVI